jgi:hypothetical protein
MMRLQDQLWHHLQQQQQQWQMRQAVAAAETTQQQTKEGTPLKQQPQQQERCPSLLLLLQVKIQGVLLLLQMQSGKCLQAHLQVCRGCSRQPPLLQHPEQQLWQRRQQRPGCAALGVVLLWCLVQ